MGGGFASYVRLCTKRKLDRTEFDKEIIIFEEDEVNVTIELITEEPSFLYYHRRKADNLGPVGPVERWRTQRASKANSHS